MRFFFMLLPAMFTTIFVNAQKKDIFKNKPWEDFKQKQLLREKLKPADYIGTQSYSKPPAQVNDYASVSKIPLTSTFIDHTQQSTDLYRIDSYNMPCVTPDNTFASNMPVPGSESGGYTSPLKKEIDVKK